MATYEVTVHSRAAGRTATETVVADSVEDRGEWVEFHSNVTGLVLRLKIAAVERIERKGD